MLESIKPLALQLKDGVELTCSRSNPTSGHEMRRHEITKKLDLLSARAGNTDEMNTGPVSPPYYTTTDEVSQSLI